MKMDINSLKPIIPILWITVCIIWLNTAKACYPGVKSVGYTTPLGDIEIGAGSDLIINCTLNDRGKEASNASDIQWVKYYMGSDKTSIRITVIPKGNVTVLDSLTARLHLMNVTECANYVCQLKSTNHTVCNNVVNVRPIAIPDVQDFKCVSHNWDSLTCKWKVHVAKSQIDKTKWTVFHTYSNGGTSNCTIRRNGNGTHENGKHECYYDLISTRPIYDRFVETFNFTLIGNDSFNPERSWNYLVDHYRNLLPDPPIILSLSVKNNSEVTISWEPNGTMKVFERDALLYEITFYSQWDPINPVKNVTLVNLRKYAFFANLIPYTLYTVKIRFRTKKAAKYDQMWSEFATKDVRTPASVPSAVKAAIDGYEDANSQDMNKRNIMIYWQALDRWQWNGLSLYYWIAVYYSNGTLLGNRKEENLTFYAHFPNLDRNESYTFLIRARNEVGESEAASEIFIPNRDDRITFLKGFYIVQDVAGRYTASWTLTEPLPVTLFWCKVSSGSGLSKCTAGFNWTKVQSGNTNYDINVDPSHWYKFAISVRNDNQSCSRGMQWQTCFSTNKTSIIVDPHIFSNDSREIIVKWELDCTSRSNILDGFMIEYCLRVNKQCEHINSTKITANSIKGSYERVIKDLKPNSKYEVSITPIYINGLMGLKNDKHIITGEGLPEDPPTLSATSVTSSSIYLAWEPPKKLNGVLNKYEVKYEPPVGRAWREVYLENSINLTSDIEGDKNYTVWVRACTKIGCSNESLVVNVLTAVGVPGQPSIDVSFHGENNGFLVKISKPERLNGPINWWELETFTDKNMSLNRRDYHSWNTSIAIKCSDNLAYSFSVRAINIAGGKNLTGPWSERSSSLMCPNSSSNNDVIHIVIYIAIAVAGSLCLIFLVAFAYRFWKKIIEYWRNVLPEIPDITEKPTAIEALPEPPLSYNKFKIDICDQQKRTLTEQVDLIMQFNPNYSRETQYGRQRSISSEASRSTQVTDELSCSNNSIPDEEVLCTHDCCREPSYDSSESVSNGNGSVSSSLTTRTNLLSDFSKEDDFSTFPPFSSDGVFVDHLAWLNKSRRGRCQLGGDYKRNSEQPDDHYCKVITRTDDHRLHQESGAIPIERSDRVPLDFGAYCTVGSVTDNKPKLNYISIDMDRDNCQEKCFPENESRYCATALTTSPETAKNVPYILMNEIPKGYSIMAKAINRHSDVKGQVSSPSQFVVTESVKSEQNAKTDSYEQADTSTEDTEKHLASTVEQTVTKTVPYVTLNDVARGYSVAAWAAPLNGTKPKISDDSYGKGNVGLGNSEEKPYCVLALATAKQTMNCD